MQASRQCAFLNNVCSLVTLFSRPSERLPQLTRPQTRQCIGRRNSRPFIVFLTSAVVCAFYAIAFTIYHVVYALTEIDETGWRWDTVGAVVTAVLTVVFVTPIAGLLGYHTRLMWSNRTTIELVSSLQGARVFHPRN